MILTTLWRNNQEKADVSELFCRNDETGSTFLVIMDKTPKGVEKIFSDRPYFVEKRTGKTGFI